MKDRIIEIVELGQPKSLIIRENALVSELIDTNDLVKELNEQLRKHATMCEFHCERFDFGRDKKCEQQCSDCHWMQIKSRGSFKEWYLEFRSEMVKSFGVDYSISIASWTYSENHKHYYDKGLTPKEAVLKYVASKNCY